MAGYDLHVHSQFSDGDLTIAELASLAKDIGLTGFALTDHDTVDGLALTAKISEDSGVDILPGLEISTEWQEREVHILAYHFDWTHPDLLAGLKYLAESRVKRVEKMVGAIASLGYPVTMEDVLAETAEGTIGRPHIAAALTKKGFFSAPGAAFSTLLVPGKPGYIPRVKFSPVEAVELILVAGGLPILAHPRQDDAWEFLPQLIAGGLLGLEVYHSSHSIEDEKSFYQMALEKKLLVTAGSDFHGRRGKAGVLMGCRRLTNEEVETQGFLI